MSDETPKSKLTRLVKDLYLATGRGVVVWQLQSRWSPKYTELQATADDYELTMTKSKGESDHAVPIYSLTARAVTADPRSPSVDLLQLCSDSFDGVAALFELAVTPSDTNIGQLLAELASLDLPKPVTGSL